LDIKFDVNGNKSQLKAINAWNDDSISEIVYGGMKGQGKSWLGASLIFYDAFRYPNTRYFIARTTLTSLNLNTTPTIFKVFQSWKIDTSMYKYNGEYNYWKLYNGSIVQYVELKDLPSDPNYTRYGSMEMTRGWVEEGGECDDKRGVSNLANSLGRCNKFYDDKGVLLYEIPKKLLITCNPSKNFLYSDYYLKNKTGELEKHKLFIQTSINDNKYLGQEYTDSLIDNMQGDESAIQRLVYGNWEFNDNEMALFVYEKVIGLFTNPYIKKTGHKYMTCDIAYEGSDLFVVGIWDGFVLEKVISIEKINEVLVASKLHKIRLEYGVPISNVIYDADGLRAFVKESSKTGYLRGAYAFYNNKKCYGRENYVNLKAQCYYKLAEMVNRGAIYIADLTYRKQIIKDLEQIRKKPILDDGKLGLERKSDLKKRYGRSPDYADMIALRLVTEVKQVTEIVAKWY